MTEAYDLDFAAAVMQAAMGDGATLAAILRSDRPLGVSERALLAELVEGELSRPHGRQPLGPGHPKVVSAVAEYRAAIKAGEMKKNAAADVAARAGVSLSTIRQWDKITRRRTEALRRPIDQTHSNSPVADSSD